MAEQDIPPAPPPEMEVIKLARKAARLTAVDAAGIVRRSGGKISDTYWRDAERGRGWRRGSPVAVQASASILAQMAHAVGVTPGKLREAACRHPDGAGRERVEEAARVLDEMLRRDRPAVTVLPTAAVLPPSQAAESLWGQEVLAAAQPYALKVAFRLLELRNQGTPNPDGTQMFGTWDEWDDPRAIGWWDKNREDLDDQDLVWLIARMRAKQDRGARRNSGSALPRPPRRHLDAPLPVGGWRTSVTETAGAALDSSRA